MKKNLIILLALCFFSSLSAQSWKDNIKDPSNFYSIRDAFLDHLKELKKDKILSDPNEDDLEKAFRRWENFMEPRVYPSGKLPPPGILLDEINKFNVNNYFVYDSMFFANWKPLESDDGFPYNGYSGRLNCIAFHPLDSNITFAGSPSGGLWKTTDGGESWLPKTDYFPSMGVSEIVINPQNPNIIYLATGDRDAANFISNPYSYGLLRSTNGGDTWIKTGLEQIFKDEMTIQRVIIHPTKPNILMAAVTGTNGALRGIWRTTDEGQTWKNVAGGAKYTVEFNPANPDIVYTTGWKYFARSTNAGADWTTITTPDLPSAEITSSKIAVTPASPNSVYIQFQNASSGMTYGLYKSNDAGVTWKRVNSFAISTQAGYDWTLTVSPIDTNIILYGGQNFYGSVDGGITQGVGTSGHVDHHDMKYRPGSNVLYNCNDGGLYKSYNDGRQWLNMNKTFRTFQYYRLGCSVQNRNLIVTGAQDNGSQLHNSTQWQTVGGADGGECIIDYTDTNIYYYTYQYGTLNRRGQGIGNITQPPNAGTSNNAWITPYLIHPKDPKILFYGGKDIYKTMNRGNIWSSISNKLTAADGVGGGMIRSMAISESNPDSVLYAASYVVVYRTTDAGQTWQNITSNLPTSAGCFDCSAISGIAVHPDNPDIAWVTMSGYSDKNKIFKTVDGGKTWQNISSNLPYVPVNCIVYQKGSKDAIYIGTDIGVFFKDSTMNSWLPFMTGLPNVPVSELEIHYGSQTIRAATFGRGLWESNLYGALNSINTQSEEVKPDLIVPNPASEYIELPEGMSGDKELAIYNALGSLILRMKPEGSRMNINFLPQGIYFLKIDGKVSKFVKQ